MFYSHPSSERLLGEPLPPLPVALMLRCDAGAKELSFCETDGISFDTLETLSGAHSFGETLRQSAEKEWVGGPKFLLATLALLNARNASEIVDIDMTKSNKRRKLLRKPLLYDYHLLCIPSRYKQRNVESAGEDTRQLRAHFVRGHFKLRKTGLFFWSAYQRGNVALGFAHKDYVLTKPRACVNGGIPAL
jgi:hypothetical protein